MTEIIDKVAEAIREKIGTRHHGLPKGGWDGLMRMAAIAAIDAMEPTKDMLEAGAAAQMRFDSRFERDNAEEIFEAMIDAALPQS